MLKRIFLVLFFPLITHAQIKELRHYQFKNNGNKDNPLLGIATQLYRCVIAEKNGNIKTLQNIVIGNAQEISAISFNPTGSYFVTANDDYAIEFRSFKEVNHILKTYKKKHLSVIKTIIFSPDARYMISNSSDGIVSVWNLENDMLFRKFKKPISANTIAISQNGVYLAIDVSNDIHIWYIEENVQVATLSGHKGNIFAMKFSHDNALLSSAGDDGNIILWNTKTWTKNKNLQVPNNKNITALDFHFNNKYLITGADNGEIDIWNIKKNQIIKTLINQTSPINNIHFWNDFNKQSSLFYVSDSYGLYIYDTNDLEPEHNSVVKESVDNFITKWSKRKETETIDEYQKRVNDSTMRKEYNKKKQEFTTNNALKKHKLESPDKEPYDKQSQSYNVTFAGLRSIPLHVSEEEQASFESNYNNLQYQNPVFALGEDDEFYLTYIEAVNPETQKVYIYDITGNYNTTTNKEEEQTVEEMEFVPVEIIREVVAEEEKLKTDLKESIKQETTRGSITENVISNVNTSTEIVNDEKGNQIINYHIQYLYEIIKKQVTNVIDDYPPGEFRYDKSKAAITTLDIIKKTFEDDIAKYMTPDKKNYY